MTTIDALKQIAHLIPMFEHEQYGIVVTGPSGKRLIVSDDGGDLLVGLYANADADTGIDGIIIPADAYLIQKFDTIREWVGMVYPDHVTILSDVRQMNRDGSFEDVDRTAIIIDPTPNHAGMIRVMYTSHVHQFGLMGWTRAESIVR